MLTGRKGCPVSGFLLPALHHRPGAASANQPPLELRLTLCERERCPEKKKEGNPLTDVARHLRFPFSRLHPACPLWTPTESNLAQVPTIEPLHMLLPLPARPILSEPPRHFLHTHKSLLTSRLFPIPLALLCSSSQRCPFPENKFCANCGILFTLSLPSVNKKARVAVTLFHSLSSVSGTKLDICTLLV